MTRAGLKRVALLGTRFTIETRMFGRLDDIEVVMPQARRDRPHPRIYHGCRRRSRLGCAGARSCANWRSTFVARDGAEAVLIAGTDLSTVFTESNAGFPMLDCAGVHIDAIVDGDSLD